MEVFSIVHLKDLDDSLILKYKESVESVKRTSKMMSFKEFLLN